MSKPCQLWPFRRTPGHAEFCGKMTAMGVLAPPWADIPVIPACRDCITAHNWPAEFVRNLDD